MPANYVGCLWAPLVVLTQSKETVFWSNLVFFTIKRFWQFHAFLNMRKSHFLMFLVLLGPIISRFFACSNVEKNRKKQHRLLAQVLSLWFEENTWMYCTPSLFNKNLTRLKMLAGDKHASLFCKMMKQLLKHLQRPILFNIWWSGIGLLVCNPI